MAKRTETRAAAAAGKSPKARPTGDASRPAASSTPKAPTKATSAAKDTAAKSGAAKEKATKVQPRKATAAPAAKAPARQAAGKPATQPPASGKAASRDATAALRAKTKTVKASGKTKPAKTSKAAPRKPKMPHFLATELGHPVDHDGEPIGAGSRAALADTELQRYTLQLWRQMQSRRGVNTHIPAMERAGVTIDQIWTAGVTDRLTTSSSPDDVKRYRQKLLFRANLLESILTETVDELQRLGTIDPTPPRAAEPG